MRRCAVRMIVLLAPVACGSALAAACGETLPEDGVEAPPARDGGTEGSSDASETSDASGDGTSDAPGDGASTPPGWNCVNPQRSQDFGPVQECMGSRADAGCDNDKLPPAGPCDPSDAASGSYCTLCTSEAGVFHYETVSCTCHP